MVLGISLWAMRPQAASPMDWVASHRNLPDTFADSRSTPKAFQRAIFKAYSVETKARVMKERLQEVLTGNP